VVAVPTGPRKHPAADPVVVLLSDQPSHVPSASGQTELSTVSGQGQPAASTFLVPGGECLGGLPAVHLEALVMVAAATDASWVAGGWSAPAPGKHGPTGRLSRDAIAPPAAHILVPTPSPVRSVRSRVVGCAVPHITSSGRVDRLDELRQPGAMEVGRCRLRPDVAHRSVVQQRWRPVDHALEGLAPVTGPPTALFLLPYLAVGGAERLLFDLLEGLRTTYRLLVVTTDPHLADLGQTVDRARELTPHVYTLGDWLPREVVGSAIRHLVRRWRVRSLVCWNGSVIFFDEVGSLRARFPDLLIANQLFNHRGGWIEHYSPSFARAVDVHLAVNGPIADALVSERAVPPARVVTIHHAVGHPDPVDPTTRSQIRRKLGIADDTVVVGSFIRMHPQKRPLDIVRLARMMTGDGVHFLLVGGGPLDREVDREIERAPVPNLTRLPLHPNASELYPAVDLCLLTSDFEGLPVFLLDGLARGIPCVATAVGDIPMLLAEGGGRSVQRPGDLAGLATAVRDLLDRDRRRAEGDRGRRTVRARFGLDAYVSAYESVIFPEQ
jgi:glycosyltransferase involved in cell wall biosynthesis